MRISDWSSDVCSSDLLARRRPVGEDALAVAHRLADRRARRLHLRPDTSDERLRRFAARNVHLVEELRLLAELVHDLADLRRAGIDSQLEGEPEGVVRRRLHHGDNLARIVARETAAEKSTHTPPH